MNPISSNSSVSRRSALSWTLLLLLPNAAFFTLLFWHVSPTRVIAEIYSIEDGVPSISRLPAACGVAGIALALLRYKRPVIMARLAAFCCSATGISVLFCGTALVVAALLGVSFFDNLARAMWGVAVLVCATGIGLRLLDSKQLGLESKHFESPLERMVLSTALGLGVLSLSVFGLASLGCMSAGLWRVIVFFCIAVNFLKTRALAKEWVATAEKRLNETPPFILVVASFCVLYLIAHAPLIWNLPVEYDVLEYHLGAPAQYLRAGSMSFLHDNIYATFSENGEMIFLLPMMLADGKIAGLPGAHVLLTASWILSILGTYALARRLECSMSGAYDRSASPGPIAAALVFALIPMGSQLAADFYVEHIQSLFHIAALLCGCAFLSDFKIRRLFNDRARSNPTGWLICAGLFAGLCSGAKYTGLIFTLAPLAVFLPGFCLSVGTVFDAVVVLGQLSMSALLVFAPWLVRNGWASGDPLHPLGLVMRRRIAGASGIPDRLDHFEAAVRTGELSWRAFAATLKQLMPGFRTRYPEDIACGPQVCFFAVPGFASVSNAETLFVAFVFVVDLLAWYFFSHRLNRFFYPHLTALAALGGLGFGRIWRIEGLRNIAVGLCCFAVMMFGPIQLCWVTEMSSRVGVAGNASLIDIAKAQIPEVPVLALAGTVPHASLPPTSRVLFIGEAQTFYCERTPSYSVVFNESLLEEALHKTTSTAEALSYLKQRGITHLYFHYLEWLRLDTSYALTLSEDKRRWEFVRWNESENLKLRSDKMKWALIRDKNFIQYRALWPDDIFPAYLKLSPQDYQRLDDLYRNHSIRIWPESDGPLELRELQ